LPRPSRPLTFFDLFKGFHLPVVAAHVAPLAEALQTRFLDNVDAALAQLRSSAHWY
jgi:hypothetical protein